MCTKHYVCGDDTAVVRTIERIQGGTVPLPSGEELENSHPLSEHTLWLYLGQYSNEECCDQVLPCMW